MGCNLDNPIATGEFAPAPTWVANLIVRGANRPAIDAASAPQVELDLMHNIARAREYLETAPEAIEGAGGDQQTFAVAAGVRDFGVSEAIAIELMQDWNEVKAVPPWSQDELATKVNNAYQYAERPIGSRTPEIEFEELPAEVAEATMGPGMGSDDLLDSKVPLFQTWQNVDFAALPPRDFIYGKHYVRSFASATIAPGGLGKSSLVLAECIAMATGKPLLGVELKARARVVYYNAEDPMVEIQRRVGALLEHHQIGQDELEGHLWLASGRDADIVLVAGEGGGVKLNNPMLGRLLDFGITERIDVFVFDPLVNMIASPETNEVFARLGKALSRFADAGRCSVEIVHHSRKLNGKDIEIEDARGGSALIGAVRAARVLSAMTREDAAKGGLTTHIDHFCVVAAGKNNLARSPEVAAWYRRADVRLANGDYVAAVERWLWPDAGNGVSVEQVLAVQTAIGLCSELPRLDPRSGDWVGKIVARELGFDLDESEGRSRVKLLVKQWIKAGALVVARSKDGNRMVREYVKAGEGNAFGKVEVENDVTEPEETPDE